MIRAVFAYENLDSTADLNLRFEKIFSSGVFHGGEITANGANNTVTIAPFRAMTSEGLVVLDDANTNITVPGNQKTYLCLRVQYAAPSQPTIAWVMHTLSSYNADPNKQYLIRFGTVDASATPGPIFSNLLSYQDRDQLTPVGYDKFLGVHTDLATLQAKFPATAPTIQKHDDIALVSSGISSLPTWYRWNSTAGAFQAFNSYTSEIATLNSHIADSSIHVTPSQSAALAGTAGTPGAGNRYVTESDVTRILDPAERQAIANAVGLDAGLSDQNPLVADKLSVVSHLLIQMIADGGNVAAITAASFGGSAAVVYVGKQGVDSNGRSSASQYFNIEDLFGDGLAPVIGGVESPVTIVNVGWNAVTGSTLNPSSNPQVDQNGFLTINPGQTLYLNLNINVPLSTQYVVRMNVKGRVRDLVPNWNAPVSYPARAAATAFRSGRQPYVLANTGDFKTFRVGDPVKSNVFISADQVGYPSSGYVKFGFYAGANTPSNLKGLVQAYVGVAGNPALSLAFNSVSVCNDPSSITDSTTVFRVRDAVYSKNALHIVDENIGSSAIELATKRVTLDKDGTVQSHSLEDATLFGAVPTHTFIANKRVGVGHLASVSYTDPGGTTTYNDVVHIRGGRSNSSLNSTVDLMMMSSPASDYDVDANNDGAVFVLHRATKMSDTTAAYTLWARKSYSSGTKTLLNLAVSDGAKPVSTISIGPAGFFTVTGVDYTSYAVKVSNGLAVTSGSFTAVNRAQFNNGLRTYGGLNAPSGLPSIDMRINDGASIVNGVGMTPYNGSKIRLGADTTYAFAGYAADQAGVYREGFIVGNSDAVLLPNATNFGSVRFGSYGYQVMWDKETVEANLSSCLVIEESNTAVRELLIGRRLSNGGGFQFASAVRIREGKITLPYIDDATALLEFSNAASVFVNSSDRLSIVNGSTLTITGTGINIGQAPTSGGSSILDFSAYGRMSMGTTGFEIRVGANANDRLGISGTTGNMAVLPNTTFTMDLGSGVKAFRTTYTRGLVTEYITINANGVMSIVPNVPDVVDLGASNNKFGVVYASSGLVTDSILIGTNHISPVVTGAVNLGSVGSKFNNGYFNNLDAVKGVKTATYHAVVSATSTGSWGNVYSWADNADVANYVYNITGFDRTIKLLSQITDAGAVDETDPPSNHYRLGYVFPDASLHLGREITLTLRCMDIMAASKIGLKTSLDSTVTYPNLNNRTIIDVAPWMCYTIKLKAVPFNVIFEHTGGLTDYLTPLGGNSWLVLSITSHKIYS